MHDVIGMLTTTRIAAITATIAAAIIALVIFTSTDSNTLNVDTIDSESVTSAAFEDFTATETVLSTRTRAELATIGADAEAMISYDWAAQLPGWTVKYQDDSAGYKGLTHLPTKTITLYVDAGADAADVAGILAHELGHALDVTHLNDDERVEYLEARDMPMTWWVEDGVSDFHSGAGDFAEAVAALWVDSPSHAEHGEFTEAQLELVAEMLP